MTPTELLETIRRRVRDHDSGTCEADVDDVRRLCSELKPHIHTLTTQVCLIDAVDTQSVSMVDIPLSMDMDDDVVQIVPEYQAVKKTVDLPLNQT